MGIELIAVIPARGNSKTLPGKNIKEIAGKPLIAWTIEAAKKSRYVSDVIVSTDSETIAEISKRYGADVPFLRDPALAHDDTPTIDVLVDLVQRFRTSHRKIGKYMAVLQPTSPLRTAEDIDRAVEILSARVDAEGIVSIVEVSESPYWMKRCTDSGFLEDFVVHDKVYLRRQDLPVVYRLNGAIYICRTEYIMKNKSLIPSKTLGYLMSQDRSVDIDDAMDFRFAELVMTERGFSIGKNNCKGYLKGAAR